MSLDDRGPIVAATDEAVEDFYHAVNEYLLGDNPEAVNEFLDEWVTLELGCDVDNDFCDNEKWATIARRSQSGPYLEKIFGCSTTGASSPASTSGLLFVVFAVFLLIRTVLCRRSNN